MSFILLGLGIRESEKAVSLHPNDSTLYSLDKSPLGAVKSRSTITPPLAK